MRCFAQSYRICPAFSTRLHLFLTIELVLLVGMAHAFLSPHWVLQPPQHTTLSPSQFCSLVKPRLRSLHAKPSNNDGSNGSSNGADSASSDEPSISNSGSGRAKPDTGKAARQRRRRRRKRAAEAAAKEEERRRKNIMSTDREHDTATTSPAITAKKLVELSERATMAAQENLKEQLRKHQSPRAKESNRGTGGNNALDECAKGGSGEKSRISDGVRSSNSSSSSSSNNSSDGSGASGGDTNIKMMGAKKHKAGRLSRSGTSASSRRRQEQLDVRYSEKKVSTFRARIRHRNSGAEQSPPDSRNQTRKGSSDRKKLIGSTIPEYKRRKKVGTKSKQLHQSEKTMIDSVAFQSEKNFTGRSNIDKQGVREEAAPKRSRRSNSTISRTQTSNTNSSRSSGAGARKVPSVRSQTSRNPARPSPAAILSPNNGYYLPEKSAGCDPPKRSVELFYDPAILAKNGPRSFLQTVTTNSRLFGDFLRRDRAKALAGDEDRMANFIYDWAQSAAYWSILPAELEAVMDGSRTSNYGGSDDGESVAVDLINRQSSGPKSMEPRSLEPTAIATDEELLAAAAAAEANAADLVAEAMTSAEMNRRSSKAQNQEEVGAMKENEKSQRVEISAGKRSGDTPASPSQPPSILDGSQFTSLTQALAFSASSPSPAASISAGDQRGTKEALGPLLLDAAVEAAKLRSPRIIAIGDVHGCVDELQLLLKRVNYHPGDAVIFLGDLVAKGPDSCGAVQMAYEMGALGVRGNHEFEVIRWHNALKSGMKPPAIGGEHYHIACALPKRGMNWIKACPWYMHCESLDTLFVHAGFVAGLKLSRQNPRLMMNMRSILPDGTATAKHFSNWPWARLWEGPETVIFGHDADRGLQLYSNAMGIDTGCVYGGRLTACVLPEKKLVSVSAKRQYLAFRPRKRG